MGKIKKILSVILTVLTLTTFTVWPSNSTYADNNDDKMVIAMALDNNFAFPTIVTMTSLLENADHPTDIKFYLLLSGGFSKKNKRKIMSLEKKYGCSVNLIDMGKKYSNNRVDGHIHTATYYRLQLPSILSNEDKCLYLDGDMIVRKDLLQMYNNLDTDDDYDRDDFYIAGVKDWSVQMEGQKHADFLGIPSLDNYVNAGMLIMNLKKMREDNIEKKFEDFLPIINNAGKQQVHHDQDILNAVCFGKILTLPLKYNAMTGKSVFSLRQYDKNPIIQKCYTREEWIEASKDPTIIHFTWKKPWEVLTKKFADKWWSFAQKTSFINEIKEKYQRDFDGIPFFKRGK